MHGKMATRAGCRRTRLHDVWRRNKQENVLKCCINTWNSRVCC